MYMHVYACIFIFTAPGESTRYKHLNILAQFVKGSLALLWAVCESAHMRRAPASDGRMTGAHKGWDFAAYIATGR